MAACYLVMHRVQKYTEKLSCFCSAWIGSTRLPSGLPWRPGGRSSSWSEGWRPSWIYIQHPMVKLWIMWPAYLDSWPPAPSPSALSETGTRWAWPWTWCRRERPCWSPPAPFRWSPRSGRGSRGFSWRKRGRSDVLVSTAAGDQRPARLLFSNRTFWTCRWRTPVSPQTPRWAASAGPSRCGWSLSPQAALKDKCDLVGAPLKPKLSSRCLNTADYFHYSVSSIKCRRSVKSCSLPDIPSGCSRGNFRRSFPLSGGRRLRA